jgi:hypothetical protein
MKAHHAQVLDRLVAAKGDKQFRERLNERSCKALSENTSPSEASYSASICCTIGPKALLEVWMASFDMLSGSFGYNGKTELVQISIRIYDVGKNDALPSAPGGSAF